MRKSIQLVVLLVIVASFSGCVGGNVSERQINTVLDRFEIMVTTQDMTDFDTIVAPIITIEGTDITRDEYEIRIRNSFLLFDYLIREFNDRRVFFYNDKTSALVFASSYAKLRHLSNDTIGEITYDSEISLSQAASGGWLITSIIHHLPTQ